jgi:heme/copper-type cytochrome/quinol oxidase subunit 3
VSTESLVNKEALAPEEPEDFGERWRTGAILMMVADGSFVVALSFAFLYLRGIDTQTSFHPGGTGVASLWWPWIVTALMIASFVAYCFGLEAHEPGRRHFLNAGAVAVGGMTVALVLNIVEMYRFPFTVSDNAYSSAVWVIAAGNVFHLLITVFLGLGIVIRVRRRVTRGARDWHVRIVGIWYGWVCVAALIGAITVTVANGTVGCPLPKDQPDPGARSVLASSCPSSSR